MPKLPAAVLLLWPLAAGAAPPAAPSQAGEAAGEPPRDSWYIGFGIGWGDGRVSDASGASSFGKLLRGYGPVNLAFNFKVGATLGPRMLLGLDVTAVRAAGSAGAAVEVVQYAAMLTFFPFERGLFVRGGAGLASLISEYWLGRSSWTGFGLAAGLGYAFWLGGSFHLSLNADLSTQWYGGSGPGRSELMSFYLGFDWT